MRLNDQYLGRITPDEAREAHSNAERDREHMPSAAWRALHAVGQMRYEYAVQVRDGWWVSENDAGELVPTTSPMRALRHYDPEVASQIAAEAGEQIGHECCVTRRLVSDVEVVE